ncbi:SRPBCC family protein [Jatrophihabitans sp. YIM 134969]
MTADAERRGARRSLQHDPLTRALGWLSAALAGPPLARPRAFTRALGVGDGPRQQLAAVLVGAREAAAAAGLLGRPHPLWLWARVGGDAMDLTLLTRALLHHDGRGLRRTAAATAATVAITLTDLYAATTRSRRSTPMDLHSTTTVVGSPDEVYRFWSRLDRLPSFMAHLEDVRVTGEGRSHWRASAPFGRDVEWDAETTDDVPGRRIAWRSLDGAQVPNAGEVSFVAAPGDRGTEVHVALSYDLPGGALGKAVAKYFGEEPSQQLDDDLRRFKQVFETGEVIRSDGAPHGKRAREEFPQHPARPLSDAERAEMTA